MKSKTTQQNTNTYGWMAPQQTAQQSAYDQHVKTAYDTPDPTIPYTFGNMKQNVNNRFDDPFGFNYSPEVKGAIKYSENNRIDQMHGQALREDRFNRTNAKTSALAGSAGMAAPQLVQTGGSMQGTQTQAWGTAAIGAVGSVGSAWLG